MTLHHTSELGGGRGAEDQNNGENRKKGGGLVDLELPVNLYKQLVSLCHQC